MLVKEWLGLVNVQAIGYYKNRMLDKLVTSGQEWTHPVVDGFRTLLIIIPVLAPTSKDLK